MNNNEYEVARNTVRKGENRRDIILIYLVVLSAANEMLAGCSLHLSSQFAANYSLPGADVIRVALTRYTTVASFSLLLL